MITYTEEEHCKSLLIFLLIEGEDMRVLVAIANKIYEIDRRQNSRIVYSGPENMTIYALNYHYENRLIYFTDPTANKVR